MMTRQIHLYQYSIPLKDTLMIRGTPVSSREGLIVHYVSKNGAEGLGEIAPLSGVHEESLEQALLQTRRVAAFLTHSEIPDDLYQLNGKFQSFWGEQSLYPSVQYGMEAALLNAMAQSKNTSLHTLISQQEHEWVPVNGLAMAKGASRLDEIQQMIESGFTSIKCKVGPDTENEIPRIREIAKFVEGKALLHLDANRQWDLDEAVHFIREIGISSVDYIEEPLKNHDDIQEFFNQTMVPVALDETLWGKSFQEIQGISGVDVLILKPMRLGGVEKVWSLLQDSQRMALETVISSSFETGVGIFNLIQLSACSSRSRSAGLDTLKWLKKDILKEALLINHGKMGVSDMTMILKNVQVNEMEEIT